MAHMWISLHTFVAFISLNIFIYFFFLRRLIIIIFVFVLANISLKSCIYIHICTFLVNQNISVFVFVWKIGSEYIHIHICLKMSTLIYLNLYLQKNVNPNIFVFYVGLKITFVTHWISLSWGEQPQRTVWASKGPPEDWSKLLRLSKPWGLAQPELEMCWDHTALSTMWGLTLPLCAVRGLTLALSTVWGCPEGSHVP